MLAKVFGIILLAIGGIVALGIVMVLVGTALKVVFVAVKLAVPALLIYAGYRLLTRDRQRIAY